MSTLPDKMIVISGSGAYPRLIVEGAHAAGVRQVDVVAVRGSTDRATVKAADNVHTINLGGIAAGLKWVSAQGYAGACFAGQINPLSLFTARFDDLTKSWLDSLSVKNAHTVYGKLAYEFEAAGVKVFPASSFMDGHLPGVGALTVRAPRWRRGRRRSPRGRSCETSGRTAIYEAGYPCPYEAPLSTRSAPAFRPRCRSLRERSGS